METFRDAGRSVWFLCVFLLLSLLLCATNADGAIKNVTKLKDPRGNVNLSPFDQWLSAYECLLNKSDSCPDKYQLTQKGWPNVSQSDGSEYCRPGGCKEHTMAVLKCIHQVKRDYIFMDKTTVPDHNTTITHGCAYGFNGIVLHASNAMRMSGSRIAAFVSILPALFLIAHYNM